MTEEEHLEYCMRHCSSLRKDKTCVKKDDPEKRHCSTRPNQCCFFCDLCDTEECGSKDNDGCTWLF